jgi:hypothetical protein
VSEYVIRVWPDGTTSAADDRERYDRIVDRISLSKPLDSADYAFRLVDLERVHPPESPDEAFQRHERLWAYHFEQCLRLRPGQEPRDWLDVRRAREVTPATLTPDEWSALFAFGARCAEGDVLATPNEWTAIISAIDKLREQRYANRGHDLPNGLVRSAVTDLPACNACGGRESTCNCDCGDHYCGCECHVAAEREAIQRAKEKR